MYKKGGLQYQRNLTYLTLVQWDNSDLINLSCFCYDFVRICLYVPCGHLLGRADLFALVCGVLS